MVANNFTFNCILLTFLLAAPVVCISLLVVQAPYGRYQRTGWGPVVNSRIGWLVMEAPASLAFTFFYFSGRNAGSMVSLVLFFLWQIHYVDRAFRYPFLMRSRPGAGLPLVVVLLGVSFNLGNSYINGIWIGEYGSYEVNWLGSPQFLSGCVLFAAGYLLNRWSDRVLRRLRSSSPLDYQIPRGGAFELVSAPNYLGEIVMWSGFALMSWSLPALSFALFTVANLAPRALSHHAWYRKSFAGYPARRKALIPFVLIC